MKDINLYLIQILECIGRIKAYTAQGRDAFAGSTMIQDAVIRNFEIIVEGQLAVLESDLRRILKETDQS